MLLSPFKYDQQAEYFTTLLVEVLLLTPSTPHEISIKGFNINPSFANTEEFPLLYPKIIFFSSMSL